MQTQSQRLWRHWKCGNEQERASCWILYYSPHFTLLMQTQALWVSNSLSSQDAFDLVVLENYLLMHRLCSWVISNSLNTYFYYLKLLWIHYPSFVTVRHNKKLWPLCCLSLSPCRSLGLSPSPSRPPCRVWKPAREQLHRAAERAGAPPARPHTTRGHTIRHRKPARSKSWGTSTCFTATSKSGIQHEVYQHTHTHTHTHTHIGACT